jgi:hypothetical protein
MNTKQNALYIEEQLKSLLHPVVPEEDFVSNLQDRLRKKAAIAIERKDYLVLILLVFSGLIFGVILFLMINGLVKFILKSDR